MKASWIQLGALLAGAVGMAGQSASADATRAHNPDRFAAQSSAAQKTACGGWGRLGCQPACGYGYGVYGNSYSAGCGTGYYGAYGSGYTPSWGAYGGYGVGIGGYGAGLGYSYPTAPCSTYGGCGVSAYPGTPIDPGYGYEYQGIAPSPVYSVPAMQGPGYQLPGSGYPGVAPAPYYGGYGAGYFSSADAHSDADTLPVRGSQRGFRRLTQPAANDSPYFP